MIGKSLVLINAGFLNGRLQAGRDNVVIDAPADILIPGLAAVRPPGILFFALIYLAESIDETNPVEYIA